MPFPPFKPEDISKLDLEQVNNACAAALDVGGRLKFLPLRGIEEYRNAMIEEVKDACDFETVKIRGLKEPSALRDYKPGLSCSRFVDALENKTDIMTVWREAVDQQCKRNGAPAACAARNAADAHRPNGMEWVRLYLTTFGWSNCANAYTYRNVNAKQLGQMRADLEKQFVRMFKVAKTCEQAPDGHPEFGPQAIVETDIPPGTPATKWNIVSLGLFCGSAKVHPGKIVLFVYGFGAEALQTGKPLAANINVDGKEMRLNLQPYGDVALAPVNSDFVRRLSHAHSASVRMIDYNSPDPDQLKLDNLASMVKSALPACFRL
jgi:hypothetical protein